MKIIFDEGWMLWQVKLFHFHFSWFTEILGRIHERIIKKNDYEIEMNTWVERKRIKEFYFPHTFYPFYLYERNRKSHENHRSFFSGFIAFLNKRFEFYFPSLDSYNLRIKHFREWLMRLFGYMSKNLRQESGKKVKLLRDDGYIIWNEWNSSLSSIIPSHCGH